MKTVSRKTIIIMCMCTMLLFAATVFGTLPARAVEQEDGGTVPLSSGGYISKEEVVYASLDANGKPQEAYIVNILDVKTAGAIEDYGGYSSVKNLTTDDVITLTGEKVTVTAPIGDFYYQGNIEQPKLPWLFEITYKLDGKTTDPQTLGGRSGRLEIGIRTIPNAAVDSGWAENCMLQTQITLDAALCRGIEADGGMTANAGANKLITFTTLPGEEGDIHVFADVAGFTMPGIQFSAVPMRMSIGEIDTSEMTDQLDELTDAIAELDKGVGEMRNGAQKLKDGAADYTNGARTFQNGLAQAAGGGAELKAGSVAIGEGLAALSGGLTQTAAGVSALPEVLSNGLANAAAQAFVPDFASLTAEDKAMAIASIEPIMGSVLTPVFGDGTPESNGLISGLNGLSDGLSALSGQYQTFGAGLGAYTDGVAQAAEGAGQLTGGAAQIESGIADFQDGIVKLKDGTAEMRSETAGMGDKIQEKVDEMMDVYDKSDYVPLSFASPRGGAIRAIQFVITSASIEEPEPPATEEKEAGKESILDRLLALFGG